MSVRRGVREQIIKPLMAAIKGAKAESLKLRFFNHDHPATQGLACAALTCQLGTLIKNALCGGPRSS